jgi:hypothetical protein
MLQDVEKAVTRLEYKKFLNVRQKTTRIAPPIDPGASVTASSVTNLHNSMAASAISPVPRQILPPSAPYAPDGYAPPAMNPMMMPNPPAMAGSAAVYSPVPVPPTMDRDIEAKKKELQEMERRLFEEREKHRRAVEKTKTIEKKKKMINGKDILPLVFDFFSTRIFFFSPLFALLFSLGRQNQTSRFPRYCVSSRLHWFHESLYRSDQERYHGIRSFHPFPASKH